MRTAMADMNSLIAVVTLEPRRPSKDTKRPPKCVGHALANGIKARTSLVGTPPPIEISTTTPGERVDGQSNRFRPFEGYENEGPRRGDQ